MKATVTPMGANGGLPLERLHEAETWIFDLDNTLYPPAADLFAQVDARIGGYIAEFMGVDAIEARRIQKHYFVTYGTTLRGLMTLHDVEPEQYMDYVHDIDLSPIVANGRLDAALERLPGRKIVFTNASVPHAERVMRQLGIRDRFSDVFDIVAADYVPKPQSDAYQSLIARHGLDPARSVMVEDIVRNLEPAASLGMTTVWVRNDNPWGCEGADSPFVHHVADELTDWMESVTAHCRDRGER